MIRHAHLLVLLLVASACIAAPASDDELDVLSSSTESVFRPYFDMASTGGCAGADRCDPAADQCFCQADFDHQNYGFVGSDGRRRGHHLVVSSDARADQMHAMGNRGAFYVNAMNDDWRGGAAAKADALVALAHSRFAVMPRWFLLNEISRSQWLAQTAEGARYRRYVAELARHLSERYARKVLVFSPFNRPGLRGVHHPADWEAIARHAVIGVEHYIGGGEIAANGYSESYCRSVYQSSITWYGRQGVRPQRLVLTEHFAQTPADFGRGREGLRLSNWLRAIRVRTRAAVSLPFLGYASYGWSFNQTHASNDGRWEAQDVYHRVLEGGDITRGSTAPAPSDDPGTSDPGTSDPGTSDPGTSDPGTSDPGTSDSGDPAAPTCGGLFDSCVVGGGDCCSGHACAPSDSTCRIQIGTPCTDRSQCYDGRACTGTPRVCCVIIGDGCAHDEQCCNGHQCQAGRCCVERGGGCARDDQCCSGTCGLGGCR